MKVNILALILLFDTNSMDLLIECDGKFTKGEVYLDELHRRDMNIYKDFNIDKINVKEIYHSDGTEVVIKIIDEN